MPTTAARWPFSPRGSTPSTRAAFLQNHLSIAVRDHQRRASDAEIEYILRAFDMADAEEDNHSPGVARHFFRPIHLPAGQTSICDCKSDETTVIEPDGYRWSRSDCERHA